MRTVTVKLPLVRPITLRNAFEHEPLDIYRYGEYPRYLSKPGDHQSKILEVILHGVPDNTPMSALIKRAKDILRRRGEPV
jgi:hypothetical protein